MSTGINQSDLMVLESHVVYSLSKEKTAARFFIVQCTQPNHEDLDIPVKDVIERLVIFTPIFPSVCYAHNFYLLVVWVSGELEFVNR